MLAPAATVEALKAVEADAAVLVGPDWTLVEIDGGFGVDEVVRRFRDRPELPFVFTQAPPGIGTCLVTSDLLSAFAGTRSRLASLGHLLGYRPDRPEGDPIARECCVVPPASIRDRIGRFIPDDPANVRFSKDVVSFARKIGRFPEDAPDDAFDFTAAYDPVTFSGARHGDARVWDLYRRLVGDDAMAPYLEYAKGLDLQNRMPLFVFPAAPEPNTAAKVRVADVIRLMRARLEDSWFDPRGLLRDDVGAGSGHSAYRARPLTWRDEVSGRTFANERTVSTQQTAWTFVAASRAWMPAPARAIRGGRRTTAAPVFGFPFTAARRARRSTSRTRWARNRARRFP